MTKKKDKLDELTHLTQQLHLVRQECLAASRRDDFRTVARLTREAARLNRMILSAEGAQVPALERLGDMLFTSENQPVESHASAVPGRALALVESA